MGNCCGSRSGSRPNSGQSGIDLAVVHPSGSVGKNQNLRHERLKWKSDIPLTEGQLRSKRDEFWDTAPAFEGRKEIWDALRAAAYACETGDYPLAEAIVTGANISLPQGTLMDCYDELGNRYQLPIYCLSNPLNMIEELSDNKSVDSASPESEPVSGPGMGEEMSIKFRLSTTCNDLKLNVMSRETVMNVKRKLAAQTGIEPAGQRWYFGGRLLSDRLRIEDAKLASGYVVQVVISNPDPPPPPPP